MEINI